MEFNHSTHAPTTGATITNGGVIQDLLLARGYGAVPALSEAEGHHKVSLVLATWFGSNVRFCAHDGEIQYRPYRAKIWLELHCTTVADPLAAHGVSMTLRLGREGVPDYAGVQTGGVNAPEAVFMLADAEGGYCVQRALSRAGQLLQGDWPAVMDNADLARLAFNLQANVYALVANRHLHAFRSPNATKSIILRCPTYQHCASAEVVPQEDFECYDWRTRLVPPVHLVTQKTRDNMEQLLAEQLVHGTITIIYKDEEGQITCVKGAGYEQACVACARYDPEWQLESARAPDITYPQLAYFQLAGKRTKFGVVNAGTESEPVETRNITTGKGKTIQGRQLSVPFRNRFATRLASEADYLAAAPGNANSKKVASQLHTIAQDVRIADPSAENFMSSNFGANNFGANGFRGVMRRGAPRATLPIFAQAKAMKASTFTASDIAEMVEDAAGAPNFQRSLSLLRGIMAGDTLSPKIFGPVGETLVTKTLATKSIPLADYALADGELMSYVVPLRSAHMGGILISRDPASASSYKVLSYVGPNIDITEYSTKTAVLFNKIEYAMPTIIAGTSVSTATVVAYTGITPVSPIWIQPAKLGPLSEGRQSAMITIGAKTHSISSFMHLEEPDKMVRFSAVDTANANLIAPTDASLSGSQNAMSTVSDHLQMCYTHGIPDKGWIDSGFSRDTGVPTALTSSYVNIWDSEIVQFDRAKLLYGNFNFRLGFNVTISGTDAVYTRVNFTFKTENGGEIVVPMYNIHVSTSRCCVEFDTRNSSWLSGYGGLLLARVEVDLRSGTGASSLGSSAGSPMMVSMAFFDVSNADEYAVIQFTGARNTQELRINQTTHTEIWPDPNTTVGQAVLPTNEAPAGESFKQTLRYVAVTAGESRKHFNTEDEFRAGSFWNSVKKAAKNAGNYALRKGKEGVEFAINHPEEAYAAAQQMASLAASDFTTPRSATTFGRGSKAAGKQTNVWFPSVGNSTELGEAVRMTQVYKGSSGNIKKKFAPGFCAYGNVSGNSNDLAFLIAFLNSKNFHFDTRGYSAELDDISFGGPGEVMCTIRPIDNSDVKLEINAPLSVLAPDGWHVNDTWFEGEPDWTVVFGPYVKVSGLSFPLPAPFPEGSMGWRVKFVAP
jgi:hypothetical protein